VEKSLSWVEMKKIVIFSLMINKKFYLQYMQNLFWKMVNYLFRIATQLTALGLDYLINNKLVKDF